MASKQNGRNRTTPDDNRSYRPQDQATCDEREDEPKKRTNPMEAHEAIPWSHLRKDDERDRHRHV